jgi:pimeloyl-ACP methyl ester carboxylesterase
MRLAWLRRWLRRLAIGFVALMLSLTAESLLYNLATRRTEQPARSLYGGPFLAVAGTQVAYSTWGKAGSPIVLVGGFAEASWVWQRVGPLLGQDHRVYAIDLPPFGYTERRGPYTLASWVSLLQAFEAELGITRPLVVGHSLGAAVAVADALDHRDEVSGIVLLDGDALAAGGRAGVLAHLLLNPFYTSLFRLGTGSDWLVRRVVRNAYGPAPPRLDRAALQSWERPFRVAGTPAAYRKLLSYGIQGLRIGDLGAVKVPSEVVWGADDTVDDVAAGRRSAAALHAPFLLIHGAGHLSMLSRPAAVANAIRRAVK